MIEFTEDLSRYYTDRQALIESIKIRLKHNTYDIPYNSIGVDLEEFTYGNKSLAIKLALGDLNPNITYKSGNNRVQCYDINIDVSELLEN